MELPRISDGTVTLRPFAKEDVPAAVDWLSGPCSRERSTTDGGPQTDGGTARNIVDDLQHSSAWAVLVEEDPEGWISLRLDGKQRGHLQLILSRPGLWAQGIGARAVSLTCTAAFDHLGCVALEVTRVREDAEAARVTWEDAGFGLRRRYLEDGFVYLDLELTSTCFRAKEQQIHLIAHGLTDPEAEGRLLGSAIDKPLNAIGRAQAEALVLSDLLRQVNEAVCSPLKRAKASAERAFVARDVPCTVEPLWGDRDWGAWSGKPAEELDRAEDGTLADPPEGETGAEFNRRVHGVLDGLPHGENLAVVTHGAVIASLARQLWPAVAEAPGLRSGAGITAGSITEFRRGPEGWRLVRLCDDRHLQGRKPTTELA